MSSAIVIEHVSKTLAKKPILHNISLEISEGSVFGLLGPNGAGKTTLMKCLLGLITPTVGSVSIFGQSPEDMATKRLIGYSPENAYLYKYLSGREFLAFCGGIFHMEKTLLLERIEYTLSRVGLEDAADMRLGKYSKGMLQRLNLAQAILHKPAIVFLDEPTSGLDPLGRKMVKDLVSELHDDGATVFLNTHILGDVADICDRFAILHQGRVVADEMTSAFRGKSVEDFFLSHVS